MNLKYFTGKMCTVFTHPINRNFKEESPETYPKQAYIYFVGVVEEIDSEGVWITQATTGLKSYFFKHSLIGIAEEEVLNPDNEEDAQVIDKIKSNNEEIRQKMDKYKDKKDNLIQIDEISNFIKKAEEEAKK
ncbi:MAG: hypothetical protein DWQ19_12485 [Crenarchaeota archaeon]|nr:MAG: hypothetical protein DWQ19_12485 [Thermoproteota archaeon]